MIKNLFGVLFKKKQQHYFGHKVKMKACDGEEKNMLLDLFLTRVYISAI